jgi:hypothetical protein
MRLDNVIALKVVLEALQRKWQAERQAYMLGATLPQLDETVRAMNRSSAETCRRFLDDVADIVLQVEA